MRTLTYRLLWGCEALHLNYVDLTSFWGDWNPLTKLMQHNSTISSNPRIDGNMAMSICVSACIWLRTLMPLITQEHTHTHAPNLANLQPHAHKLTETLKQGEKSDTCEADVWYEVLLMNAGSAKSVCVCVCVCVLETVLQSCDVEYMKVKKGQLKKNATCQKLCVLLSSRELLGVLCIRMTHSMNMRTVYAKNKQYMHCWSVLLLINNAPCRAMCYSE